MVINKWNSRILYEMILLIMGSVDIKNKQKIYFKSVLDQRFG